MEIAILFASETGNAETLAEDLKSELAVAHDVSVCSLAAFDAGAPVKGDLMLIITSTHGDGELPAAAQTFHDVLGPTGSCLSGRRFAVFGLGDRQFTETFGRASMIVEQRIMANGGLCVLDREVHDASGDAFMDDQAKAWCKRAIHAVRADLIA